MIIAIAIAALAAFGILAGYIALIVAFYGHAPDEESTRDLRIW